MNSIIKQFRSLRDKSNTQNLYRGTAPKVALTNSPDIWLEWWIFVGTRLLVFIGGTLTLLWMKNDALFVAADKALSLALISGISVAVLYYLLPILRILGFTAWYWQRPPRDMLTRFSSGQKFVSLALIALGIFYLFNHVYPEIVYYWRTHHVPRHWFSYHGYVSVWWHSAIIMLALTLLLGFLMPRFLPKEFRPRKTRFKECTYES